MTTITLDQYLDGEEWTCRKCWSPISAGESHEFGGLCQSCYDESVYRRMMGIDDAE